MTTEALFDLLTNNQGKSLIFEYQPQHYVAPNYHITEVKHISVDSVDCGARTDQWNETIIQLYESSVETDIKTYMSSYKALSILKKVGKLKSYDLSSEVKFEYSNANFHKSQLIVNDYEIQNNNLILKLATEKTDCKAKDACGIPEEKSVSQEAACCTPGSGCC